VFKEVHIESLMNWVKEEIFKLASSTAEKAPPRITFYKAMLNLVRLMRCFSFKLLQSILECFWRIPQWLELKLASTSTDWGFSLPDGSNFLFASSVGVQLLYPWKIKVQVFVNCSRSKVRCTPTKAILYIGQETLIHHSKVVDTLTNSWGGKETAAKNQILSMRVKFVTEWWRTQAETFQELLLSTLNVAWKWKIH